MKTESVLALRYGTWLSVLVAACSPGVANDEPEGVEDVNYAIHRPGTGRGSEEEECLAQLRRHERDQLIRD